MVSTKKTLALIDKNIEEKNPFDFRKHLGASIIGRKCARQIWYSFRWALNIKYKARVLRIFERGEKEEYRFIKWFADAGIQIFNENPKTGKQFRIKDVDGHFGGSLDGTGIGIPDLPAQPFVTEFKTHNEKSFKSLLVDKLKKAKPEHYVQLNLYVYKKSLKWGLYCAVNKNDDSLYFELIYVDKKNAQKYINRAKQIIYTDEPPIRINNDPRWFECLYCDYRLICHGYDVPAINCRTCAHSSPIKKGLWSCQLKLKNILMKPELGCTSHIYNPHMLNGVTFGDGNLAENWIAVQMPNGEGIKLGPKYVTSQQLAEYYKR